MVNDGDRRRNRALAPPFIRLIGSFILNSFNAALDRDTFESNGAAEINDKLPVTLMSMSPLSRVGESHLSFESSGKQLCPACSRRQSNRIAIKVKQKTIFIDVRDILVVRAEGNYVSLQHKSATHLLREQLTGAEHKLAHYGFVRINRSILVNIASVSGIEPRAYGEYTLRMESGAQYTVTRAYKKNLKWLASSWIGNTGLCV